MGKIVNNKGHEIDFDSAVNLMDDDIRESLHRDLAPCNEQEFYNAYCQAHKAYYETDFIDD